MLKRFTDCEGHVSETASGATPTPSAHDDHDDHDHEDEDHDHDHDDEHLHDHEEDADATNNSGPGPSPTESVGCEPHGDHWYVSFPDSARMNQVINWGFWQALRWPC